MSSAYRIQMPFVSLTKLIAVVFFLLPLLRLVFFRLTGTAIPISLLSFLIGVLIISYRVPRTTRVFFASGSLQASLLLCLCYCIYVARSTSSPVEVVTTGLAFFAMPVLYMLVGAIHAKAVHSEVASDAEGNDVDRWVNFSLGCLLIGVTVNAFDIASLNDGYAETYRGFATVAPANFGGVSVPRLSGAYFSGLDLTFAVCMLFAIQHCRNKRFSIFTSVLLGATVALTFTRNSYLILTFLFLMFRFSDKALSRIGGLLYVLSPLASIGALGLLSYQLDTGTLVAGAEDSSLITRLSSWLHIYSGLSSDYISPILGLGLSQLALSPGEGDVYAIDNFFLEIIGYAGLFAFAAYGFILSRVRRLALRYNSTALNRYLLLITALIPVGGIFNNMAGSMLLASIFLAIGLSAKQRTGNRMITSHVRAAIV